MVDSYVLYTQKLEGEYKENFEKIDMYVGANHIYEPEKEEMMSNLLDIFLNAQEEGRPVEKITGKNIEKFCKSFCSGYGLKEQMISFLEDVGGWIIFLFVISALDMAIFFIEYFEGADVSFFTYQTELYITAYGFFLLALYFINIISSFVVRRIMFRCKKLMRRLIIMVRAVVLLIPVIALLLFMGRFKTTLIPTWLCFLVFGLLTIIYRIATKERRREKKENKISFWDYYKAQENEDNRVAVEKKLFFKRNQRRIKRGQTPLTKEAFLTLELAKTKRRSKPYSYIAIPIVIIIPVVIWMYFTNQFESIFDMGFFVGIMLIVEAFIMRAFWKFEKGANKERINTIEQELSNPTSWEEENM